MCQFDAQQGANRADLTLLLRGKSADDFRDSGPRNLSTQWPLLPQDPKDQFNNKELEPG